MSPLTHIFETGAKVPRPENSLHRGIRRFLGRSSFFLFLTLSLWGGMFSLAQGVVEGAGVWNGVRHWLEKGQSIEKNESVFSADEIYQLQLSSGGVLVLKNVAQNKVLWQQAMGAEVKSLRLREEGTTSILEVVDSQGVSLWSRSGKAPGRLDILEGNLCFYGWYNPWPIIWESGNAASSVLKQGQTLERGQSLLSANKRYQLSVFTDGQIKIWDNQSPLVDKTLWDIKGWNLGKRVEMGSDGNFKAIQMDGKVFFSSGLKGVVGVTQLEMHNDGNLVVKNTASGTILWETGTWNGTRHQLQSRNDLPLGQSVESPNGLYKLSMVTVPGQSGGALQLFDSRSRMAWGTDLLSKASFLYMGEDGNLTIDDVNWKGLWASNSFGYGVSTLYVQDDGNVEIYENSTGKLIWESMTEDRSDGLEVDQVLTRGATVWSNNGQYRLTMQQDGNLVEYDVNKGTVLFQTGVNSNVAYAEVNAKGQLGLHRTDGSLIWSTVEAGANGKLKLQDDGRLALTNLSNSAVVWSSKRKKSYSSHADVDQGYSENQRALIGDFNGDRKDDYALITKCVNGDAMAQLDLSDASGGNTLSALKVGKFDASQQWFSGDANGDGKSDLMMVFNQNGGARVKTAFFNGTSWDVKTMDLGLGWDANNERWTVGDVDGDGKEDLVLIYNNQGLIHFWAALSKGDGTYRLIEQQTGWGWDPTQKWMMGDMNGDGRSDLVMIWNNNGNAKLHVAFSNGTSWGLAAMSPGWSWDSRHRWSIGDANGDGMDDILLDAYHPAQGATSYEHHAFHAAISTGTGNSYTLWGMDTGFGFYNQLGTVGDFNGDGKSDFRLIENARVIEIFSDGKGAWTWNWDDTGVNLQGSPQWLVEDRDGDGKADQMVISPEKGKIKLTTLQSLGNGKHNPPASLVTDWVITRKKSYSSHTDVDQGYSENQRALIGDFNGDRKDDYALITKCVNGDAMAQLDLSDASGGNTLSALKVGKFDASQQWFSGDANGDGKSDLMMVFNQNGGARVQTSFFNGTSWDVKTMDLGLGWDANNERWTVGDVDGDGKEDLVLIYNNQGLIHFWAALSKGDGTYWLIEQQTGWGWDSTQKWMMGDMNGDGRSDLVMIWNNNGNAKLHVAFSNGTSWGLAGMSPGWNWDSRHRWSIGDANGDGMDDILLDAYHAAHGTTNFEHHSFHAAISDGTGNSYTFWVMDTGIGFSNTLGSVGDFNGDGKTDFKLLENSNGVARVIYGFSDGRGAWGWTLEDTVAWSGTRKWLEGDRDGDGKTDQMVVSQEKGKAKLTTLQSLGNGKHTPASVVETTWVIPRKKSYSSHADVDQGYSENQRALIGDFNGDGKDDDAVIDRSGNGDAMARLNLSDASGGNTLSVLKVGKFDRSQQWFSGDANGDGKSDLMMVSNENGHIRLNTSFFNGTGWDCRTMDLMDWGWHTPTERWVVGDVDGDGKEDLVMIWKNYQGTSQIRALISQGDGTYSQWAYQDTSWNFDEGQKWMMGDIDGDGNDDVVMIGNHNPANPIDKADLYVAFSRGKTWVTTGVNSELGWFGRDKWYIGDANGDGMDDLLLHAFQYKADLSSHGAFLAAVSKGTGEFTIWSMTTNLPFYGLQESVGDFNGDGLTDFSLLEEVNGTARVTYAFSDGKGAWVLTADDTIPWSGSQKWLAGDRDGDGKSDQMVMTQQNGKVKLTTVRSLGNGRHSSSFTVETDWIVHRPKTYSSHADVDRGLALDQRWMIGDFNGDHRDDYVVVDKSSNGDAMARLNLSDVSGGNTLSVLKVGKFDSSQQWFSGDANGDGKSDLMMVSNENGHIRLNTSFFNGTGWDCRTMDLLDWGWHTPTERWVVGDVDGDGKSDLVMIWKNNQGTSQIRALISQGDGTYSQRAYYDTSWNFDEGQKWMVGDMDGDGNDDVVMIANHDSASPTITADLYVAFSRGKTWVTTGVNTPLGWFERDKWYIGDANGDGMDDILLHAFHYGPDSLSTADHGAFLAAVSKGTGEFTIWGMDTALPFYGLQESVGDFNGDGLTDFSLLEEANGTARVTYAFSDGKGAWVLTADDTIPWSGSQKWLAGDRNGDGKTDQMVASNQDKKVRLTTLPSLGNGKHDPASSVDTDWTWDSEHMVFFGFFLGGTPVVTPWGTVSIQDLSVGSVVSSADANGKVVERRVTGTAHGRTSNYISIQMADGQVINCTPEEPIAVVDESQGMGHSKWKSAILLEKNDRMYTHTQAIQTVSEVSMVGGDFMVYALEVEETHNYFVGNPGVLAHNAESGFYFHNTPILYESDKSFSPFRLQLQPGALRADGRLGTTLRQIDFTLGGGYLINLGDPGMSFYLAGGPNGYTVRLGITVGINGVDGFAELAVRPHSNLSVTYGYSTQLLPWGFYSPVLTPSPHYDLTNPFGQSSPGFSVSPLYSGTGTAPPSTVQPPPVVVAPPPVDYGLPVAIPFQPPAPPPEPEKGPTSYQIYRPAETIVIRVEQIAHISYPTWNTTPGAAVWPDVWYENPPPPSYQNDPWTTYVIDYVRPNISLEPRYNPTAAQTHAETNFSSLNSYQPIPLWGQSGVDMLHWGNMNNFSLMIQGL